MNTCRYVACLCVREEEILKVGGGSVGVGKVIDFRSVMLETSHVYDEKSRNLYQVHIVLIRG
jgi:hypothetical protein